MMQRTICHRDDRLSIIEESDLWIVTCAGHGELRTNATACDVLARYEWKDPRSRKQLGQYILLMLQRGAVCVIEQAAGAAALRLKVFAVHQFSGIRLSV
jgi:hypothetical protein